MQSWSSKDFTADRAWGALDIANFSGTTVRLHWTDQPYIWHINDGQEVFAVMDGQVAMHVKVDGEERPVVLHAPKNGFLYVIDRRDGKLLRASK